MTGSTSTHHPPAYSNTTGGQIGLSQSCSSSLKDRLARQGYVQIYCGTGKGKTTAALGLSMRILLTGGSVFFAQFFKGIKTAELGLCALCDRFVIEQYGTGNFVSGLPGPGEIAAVHRGMKHCHDVLRSGCFDLVVLDEILMCVAYQVITTEEVLALIEVRKPHVEVVLTGRKAPAELLQAAHLVTEMKKIKHYYDNGVRAREGIEF
ncbi:cob(I)yrinic acid a,c-diamide adenosyltransferase [uncultured Methanospirillum sp.]|uniref:cob(I)yrinic acid a,c-diamide adenosyltransferase n=1 Tax=uncultured Methanospirillum sp. TaxID=262503 RepID=UPI0029C83818|nr:cob(I)yrinic acid a,c-diamide adenosyltransferase [uncultured Methanospirillum sp.]